MKKNNKTFDEKRYQIDLEFYKWILASRRIDAFVAINLNMLCAFYNIGMDLNKKGTWKETYIKRIKEDCPKYKEILNRDSVEGMCKLASLLDFADITNSDLSLIPWSTTLNILNQVDSKDDFLWCINQVVGNNIGEQKLEDIFEDLRIKKNGDKYDA